MPSIETIISNISEWQGKEIQSQLLTGGLTNTNYKVTVDGIPYFVRIPGASTELLAVNRDNEVYNSRVAALTGVGPQVLHHLPEYQVMVLEFLPGRTLSKELLNATGMPQQIALSLKRLHGGSRFLTDFNMFRLSEYYLQICSQHNIPIPDGYTKMIPEVARIEQALAVHPVPTLPCNNDLLAENYIDDGTSLRIIDYEYSGNNDPYFELGNTCQELEFKDDQIKELCQAYFGDAKPGRISRMMLYMIMSDVGWTLWAAIQAKISRIEFDFWGWAIDRWERAEKKMDSSLFGAWLLDVQS